MLISEAYAQENRELHDRYASYGSKGIQWAAYIEQLVIEEGHRSILDYGCGKGSLAECLGRSGIAVAEYDPAIPGKEASPADAADLVICLDVLEHVEPDLLDNVLSDLARLTKRKIFFDICTEPAVKVLSDGRNAHLIVKPAEWWKEQLSRVFDIVYWTERKDNRFLYGEAVPRGQPAVKSKRRRMIPEISAFVDMLRRQVEAYADAMSYIDSVSMWEGIEDRAADLQIVCDILDGPEDPKPKIADATKYTRKIMIARVMLTEERTEEYWRPMFESHLRIGNWQVDDDKLVVIGTPRVGVAGVKVVGARPSDERWEQVKAACLRIKKRITPAPIHRRKVILACYGPSIKKTISLLRDQGAAADADVISVSGAHDFLLANGVVPTFHVECDPRAHKADNIAASHSDVKYLIASCVHPVLLDKLQGADVALWHVATAEHLTPLVKELREPGKIVITGGGSVGLRAISLLYNMGYREFHIHGMDCSFGDEGREQWAGKHAGKAQEVVKVAVVTGETLYSSMVLLSYATEFIEMIQRMEKGVDVRLYGEGLLQDLCALHAKMGGGAEPVVVGPLVSTERTVDRPSGFRFPAEDMAWRNLGAQSAQILDVALNETPRRRVAVQAGGNVGVLAMGLAKHFGHVYTFEPDPDNFQCLEHNVTAPNVVKKNVALGSPGVATIGMDRTPENCGAHRVGGFGDTPVECIDQLALVACDLIILDIEGYELEALKGAEWTIRTHKPTVILEDKGLSERYGVKKGEAPRWLQDRFGYRIVRQDKRDVVLRAD